VPHDGQAQNLSAVAAWVDAYNAHDFEALAALCDDGFRVEDPATGTHIAGRDAFVEIGRQVVELYPDRRITVAEMLALGATAVALQGDWDGTAATDTPTGAHQGDVVHHDESMLVELVDGMVSFMRIYR
jgi:steroid delta-isomerase-like uncharacterized protein